MRLSPTLSALPPVRPGAAANPFFPRAAVRPLAVLPLAALALAGAASPAAGSSPTTGAPAVADTLRVTLAAPEGGSVAEGSEGSFEVSVAGSTSDGAVTVRYSVSGTATAGTDYRALSGEVTVAKGENVARIVLSALDDNILDHGETVVLTLTGASGAATAVVDPAPATATIADHGTVTVEITPMNDTLPEGAAWNSAVTLSSAVAERVSVGWRTSDGTAVAGSDYEGMKGSVIFEPGERSKPISVRTLEDDESEPVEMFYVALDPAVAATAAGGAGAWAGNGLRIDLQQRFGFIECTVEFPDGPIDRAVDENMRKGTPVGDPVAAPTESFAYYKLRGGSGLFAIDDVTGQIKTTARLDHEKRSSYVVSVSVHDDCGASDTTDVAINVNNVNEAPTVNAGKDQTVESNDPVTLSGTSTDLDGDDATLGTPSHGFAWVQTKGPTPKGGLKDANKITATFTAPVVPQTTDLVFQLTVTDGGLLSHTDAVTITVEPLENKPPKFDPPSYSFDLLTTASKGESVGRVNAMDPEGGRVSYSLEESPYFEIVPSTGWIMVKASPPEDTYELVVTAEDSLKLAATASVEIDVTPGNHAPVFNPDEVERSVAENSDDGVPVGAPVTATDEDKDELSYSLAPKGDDELFEIDASTGQITVGEDTVLDYEGSKRVYTVYAVASDGKLSDTATVTIRVTNVPPPGRPAKPTVTGGAGQVSVSWQAPTNQGPAITGYDLRHRASTASGWSEVSLGAVLSRTVTGLSPATTYEVQVRAVSAEGAGAWSASGEGTTSPPENRAPEFPHATYERSVAENSEAPAAVGAPVTATDEDKDELRYSLTNEDDGALFDIGESTGQITVGSGTVLDYEGSKRVYTVYAVASDGKLSAKAKVTIRVTNVPPPGRPAKPTVTGGTKRVSVTWRAPADRGSAITGYDLQYRAKTASAWTEVTLGVKTSHTVRNLSSATTYLVQVRAVSAEGTGEWSPSGEGTTVEPVAECSITWVGAGDFTVGEDETDVGTVGVTAKDCGALDYELTGAGASDVSAAAVSSNNDNAAITGDFNFEDRSSYDLTLTVSERGGSASNSGRVRIAVTDVNEAPRPNGTIGAQTVKVGQPVSVNVTGYFTDEDAGDVLTFTSKSSATGKLTVNASGSPVTLTGVAAGGATVTVTAEDRGGLTATQTFSVTVEAPKPCGITVSAGALSVAEDAGVGDGVDGKVGVDTTGDCGALSYALSGTGWEDFSVAAAGASDDDAKIKVKRTLDHEARDAYDLKLTVSEAGGAATGEGDVDISVTDVNEAPKAKGAVATQKVRIGRPESVDVTDFFTDEDDGDLLTFTSESSATGKLTVNASGSPVTLTGVAVGDATVTVTARDRKGLTATQTFSVTVEPKPTTPCEITVSDGALSVPEDTGVGDGVDGKVGVTTKGDCGTLGYSLSGVGAADFSVAAAGPGDDDAKLEVAKALDHETKASYALTLTVSWGTVSGEGDVGVSVTDVNEAPEVASGIPALAVNAGASKVVDVAAHFRDPEDDALTYEAKSSSVAAATVQVSGSEVTVTGVSPGESKVTVTARDGRGLSESQQFTVTVANQAPKLVSAIPALTVAAGASKVVEVSGHFSDPNGDALTYEAESSSGAATVKVVGSEVTVTGVSPGESQVTVTARDPYDATVSQAFAVTVGPENDPPKIESAIPALTVKAGETAAVDVSSRFSDPDKDALNYGAESSDEGVATVAVVGSEVRVTGVSRGEAQVTVTARDGRGGSVSQDFTVTVPNRAPEPVGSLGRRTMHKGDVVFVRVSHGFEDPDGDPLTYRAKSSDTSVVTVIVQGDEVRVEVESRGSSTVTVTADDGHGGTAEQKFEVEVTNRAPVALNRIEARTVARGGRITVGLAGIFLDRDRDTLSYKAVAEDTAVAAVSVEGADLTVEGVGRGSTEVTVHAHDGYGGSASQKFRVTVTNGPPSFEDEAYERAVPENSAAGTAVGDPVAATDADGDEVTHGFAAGGDEALFEIDASSGQITVAEGVELDFESGKTAYEVEVTASDGRLAAKVGVTIRVTDVPAPGKPDAPTVTGGTGEVTVSWSAPANEGPEITDYDLRYRAKAASGWTDAPALGAVLAHTIKGLDAGITYEVQVRAESSEGTGEWSASGEGATKTANKAPVFDAETYEREVAENSAAGTEVGAPVTATDDNDDDLTYSLVTGGEEVPFEIDAATGQIKVAKGAALDYESDSKAYEMSVRASDGTLAATAGVTISVTDVPAPGKPAAPTVTGGTEEVTVSWIAPANEGPEITGYEIRYRAKSASEWSDPKELGAVLEHTIKGLEGETTYQVQVRAISSEGAGEWSEPGEGTAKAANKAPVFDAETYEREVPENSVPGTAVGAPVTATDDDDLTYSLVTGGNEVPFEIEEATGQIKVAKGAALDYESGDKDYAVTVRASDGALAATAGVTIRITDVPAPGKPDAPSVTGGTEEVSVSWSAPANEGPEITGYEIRYRAKSASEWSDPKELGAVLAHTISGLEGETTYQVQVRAESSEGAGEWSEPGEASTNKAPSFDAETYEREVAENSAPGTEVGAPVTATDDDDLTYSLVTGGTEVPFEIDAATGQIKVAKGASLDYESGKTAYEVNVRASDGTLAATAGVTISVTDVPAPGKPDAPTVTGGTGKVEVSWIAPANEGPAITGYDLRYRAKSDGEWSDAPVVGVVLTHKIMGLEAGSTYEVQVRAESSEGAGEWSDSGEGTTEPSNRAPSFDAEAYEREVAENSPAGTAVGEPVTATDDGDDLTYSFAAGGEAPFEIDATTGRITVAEDAALNYESADTVYVVSVEASDGELAATAPVTIRVTNADEPGKVVLSPAVARVGVEMTVSLMDEDGVRNATRRRRWQRSRNRNSWNDIATGRMYNPVTSDAGKWLRVVFTYSDRHGPGKRAVSDAVRVLAANAAPDFGADAFEREVPENSPGGTRVGEAVRATDGDGDELTYSLLDGADAPFEIDAATGRIKVAEDAALNYESADTLFTVLVEASDGELADTASVKIRVTDADDPGKVALSPEVARVGVEMTAILIDEDGVRDASRRRRWQRSRNGNSWNDIGTGRMYNPVTGDAGKWLRVVFTYRDGHGRGKRAASAAVKVLPANTKPSFPAVYEREVPENSPGGTNVGAPVAATDPDPLSYSFVEGGDEALFGIVEGTGQITVGTGAALDYESGDTLYTVSVEASDGELADTASVKIRVTNADDPGKIALSADVARVGVRLTATLMDQDRSIERSKMRTWQRSPDGDAWTMVVQGAERRSYTPTEADEGKYLRAVFTYRDGHGPGKRAESPAVMVVGATTPVVSFGAESYTAAAGGSADVAVLLSPAASSALAVEVVAGDGKHTVTFQTGASTSTLAVSTAGLSAGNTLAVRFGDLPEGVAVGVPATTRIVVAAAAGDRVSRAVVEDGSRTELAVEYVQAEYTAVAGGPGTEIALHVSPAADRRVAVPLTATHGLSMGAALPDSVVFQPGDSLAAFTLDVPAGTGAGLLALGLGALPEAVSAGAVASATVDIADRDAGLLGDEAFEVGLAVFGRAVAEGARQAVGARIDAVMRPAGGGSGTAAPGSAAEWAGRAAGTLASLTGAPLGASSAADMARRSGSVDLPTGREAARRLLPSLSFATALGPQSAQGRPRLGLWAEGSAQSFRGEPGINYDGGLRALTVGADARIGSSTLLGVSLMRSDGDLDYDHRSSEGSLGHAMNSVHPYLFVQPSPRIGLWAMAGYGSGDVRDDDRHGDSGASLRMLSGGVKVPLARNGAFGLAVTGDAFTVGMSAEDGQREGSASRARALLEASWTAGGLKLATQAGARYDGGDADTGGGAETGASIGYAAHGLDLDLRGRLGLGSGRHREWGAALRLALDPGARGEGFRLAVSPRHGRDQNGIHGLMDGGTFHAMTPGTGRDWRLDAEAGYGLKNSGGSAALDSYTRLSADGRNRSWSFGTRYSVSQTLRLGIEGSRSQLPGQDPNLGLRLALDFTF